MAAARARQAHDWNMAAIVVSAWAEIDFRNNPYIERDRNHSGSFDVAALRREHRRRSQTAD